MPVPTAKAITVLQFVPAEQVDPIMFQKAYYLAPDGVAAIACGAGSTATVGVRFASAA